MGLHSNQRLWTVSPICLLAFQITWKVNNIRCPTLVWSNYDKQWRPMRAVAIQDSLRALNIITGPAKTTMDPPLEKENLVSLLPNYQKYQNRLRESDIQKYVQTSHHCNSCRINLDRTVIPVPSKLYLFDHFNFKYLRCFPLCKF